MVVVFLFIYLLYALSHACNLNEDYTSYYLLEIESRHLEEVKSQLEEDDLNLGYAEHVIADFHLFRRLKTNQGALKGNLVEKIQEKSQRRVKKIEQQCLQRLLPEEIVPEPGCFEHKRKIRRSVVPQKERCDSLHFLGVSKAWEQNYTGQNIRILVVDNGVDSTHPDLEKNFDKSMCFDSWSHESKCNPYVEYMENEDIHHGTQCAGLIAGEKGNNICGDGVAYNAKIGAARLFNAHGQASDANIGICLSYKRDQVDIYSCSFGYQSEVYESLGSAVKEAFTEGVKQGRNGKGSIYVFPSGNGGSDAHCNRNGYARNIYAITIGSVGFDGKKANYTEFCPCVLATAFGEGGPNIRSEMITTKSVIPRHDNCTWKFRGSSVSAALASGVIALALEANNNLTSRDIQHLLVRTSDTNGTLWRADWRTNGAGHRINDWFGFGLINASQMVWTAKTWKPVDELHICAVNNAIIHKPNLLRDNSIMVTTQIETDGCKKSVNEVLKLEHVEVKVEFKTEFPDQLNVVLTSPMNTSSTLMRGNHTKSNENSTDNALSWTLMSVQFWDENPEGTWNMTMEMDGAAYSRGSLKVTSVHLVLYGTAVNEDRKDSLAIERNSHEESADSGLSFLLQYEFNIWIATFTCVIVMSLLILLRYCIANRTDVLQSVVDTLSYLPKKLFNIPTSSDNHLHEEQESGTDATRNAIEKEEKIPLV